MSNMMTDIPRGHVYPSVITATGTSDEACLKIYLYTHCIPHTHTHTHTHTVSLSHTHTHTHTHRLSCLWLLALQTLQSQDSCIVFSCTSAYMCVHFREYCVDRYVSVSLCVRVCVCVCVCVCVF